MARAMIRGATRGLGKVGKKPGLAIGMAAAGIYGLGSGINSVDISDPFYKVTMGDPKADESVLGTEVSPYSLINPFSTISTVTGQNPITNAINVGPSFGTKAPLAASGGLVTGAFLGAKMRGGNLRKAIGFAGLGAITGVGIAAGTSDTVSRLRAANSAGLMNQQMLSATRYANEFPEIDGSLTFGLYNSRQGR